MLLVELISTTMISIGAALVLIGVIGLILTRNEEREERHEREDQ